MPERIIRQTDQFKVLTAFCKIVKPFTVKRIVAAVVEMDHHRNFWQTFHLRAYAFDGTGKTFFIRFSDSADTGIDKRCNIVIIRHFAFRPEQTIGKFISNLHHCDVDTVLQIKMHHLQRKIIDCLL